MKKIQVLIVDDDPTVADLHRRFVSVIDGFEVIGIARTGKEALTLLDTLDVNLIILDIFMPDVDGFGVLHKIREKKTDLDVIMITAAQEGDLIQEAVRLGVFDYLLKPFDFSRFKKTMNSFREYFENIRDKREKIFNQEEIDNVIRPGMTLDGPDVLPKGIQKQTLENIIDIFKNSTYPLSVEQVALSTGLSRVTVMRYVKYLLNVGKMVEELHYQEIGRPVSLYQFLA